MIKNNKIEEEKFLNEYDASFSGLKIEYTPEPNRTRTERS